MDVQFGPNSIDERNLLYKTKCKIKVFNTNNSLPNRGYNLVATSSRYGIVFVASPEGTLSVYYLKDMIENKAELQHLLVKLPEKPTHIAVSCDQELLAVTGGQLLCIYKITNFQNQNVSPSVSIKSEVNPKIFVSALQWNPCVPDSIAMAFFDGTLLVCQVNTGQSKKVQSKARCICWSPKGKQLVTGNSDGTLCQYKPDLTPAKMIPAPNLFEGSPVEALAIYWISTFQFAVVYKNAADNSRPAVTIVNTPKAGQPSCLNYEDICYSMGSNRPWYYYLQGIAQWNMILSSSSNSMEIATLGSADGASWLQWCQTDEARPELPLMDKKYENYPVGICIDTCALYQMPWGENETLPFMPHLLVLSHTGLLSVFIIINLKKDSPQVCTPPQPIVLPAAALTSDVPGDVPPQAQAPPPQAPVAQPAPQPVQQPIQVPQAQPAFGTSSQFSAFQTNVKPVMPQMQPAQGFTAGLTQPVAEHKQPEMKPTMATPQQQVIVVPQHPKPVTTQTKQQAQDVNAVLKAEQEKFNKLKADQELRNMLVKEVNDFQMELYKFVVKTRNVQNKLQHDLDSIDATFAYKCADTEQLKKDCALEELRNTIVQLKLELVRACAVVAEARTHAEAKDLHQWTQADPLTTKRVASVKKLAYYVQSQLEQAHKALEYKWNEMNRDSQYNKPGQKMIRPVLDDVYQPLVKQQEILSRQQAVLRTLRNTLKECDVTPMFKSTSLLRSTPFRNKDPLSKLTKNILNMSIEPQTNKIKEPLLTPHKLDALRDMLSNHRPIKIKPVNVELRQHLAAMRLNYEKSMKEKAAQASVQASNKPEPVQQPSNPAVDSRPDIKYNVSAIPVEIAKPEPMLGTKYNIPTPAVEIKKPEAKPDLIVKQPVIMPTVPTFTPVNNIKQPVSGLSNVARTLFTDEPKQESKLPQPQPPLFQQQAPVKQTFRFAPPASGTVTANTRSVLKDMLQNKQANAEAKSDGHTFLGQKICSPSNFAFSPAPATPSQPVTATFTSKPISDINNMLNKFAPQTFAPEAKPQSFTTKPKSDETGEFEVIEPNKQPVVKKEEKPLTNLFGMKTSTPLAGSSQNVPDVLKNNTQTFTAVKTDTSKSVKPVDKISEKTKENISENNNVGQGQKAIENKNESESTIFGSTTSKQSTLGSPILPTVTTATSSEVINMSVKPTEPKFDVPKPETPNVAEKLEITPSSSGSSIFAVANSAAGSKPSLQQDTSAPSTPTTPSTPVIESSSTQPTTKSTDTTTKEPDFVNTTNTSASFLFGTAVASQPVGFGKTTSGGSIFTSSTTTPSSVFGASTQGSIFGTATTTTPSTASSVFGTSTTQSDTNNAASPKPAAFNAPASPSPTSVFGTTTSTVFGTSAASVFASANTQATAFGSTPVFGGIATTAQSVFSTATTSTQSVFGSTATTTQGSIFATAAVTTQTSIFGSSTTTTSSVFGGTPATTQASIFGSPATSQASVFGSSPQTTQSSVFGATTQASVFGTPTSSTQASIFGGASETTQASVFGTPTQTTQASVFGTPPATTAQSGSLFGGAESNLFAAASISTTSASSPTSGGNIFGGGSSGSVFGGGGTNVFGGKAAFGQSNSTAASIFGGGGATSFGQKSNNNFWSSGNANTGGGFGSGFGQQATTQSSSIFGGGGTATGGSFSSPSSGQAFGSPQQTSVFGSPQQQATPAFGGAAAFGSKPVFGQSPGFGSPTSGGFGSSFGGFNKSPSSGFGAPASFGGGATFGGSAFGNTSPGKMFGGGAPAPSFGAPTQSNATFESLATQNTLTFGNLAQQSGQPSQQAPTFNTSPSFTGWRG